MQALPESLLRELCRDNPAILTETVSAISRKNPDLSPEEIMEMATHLICPENIDFPELSLNPETVNCLIGNTDVKLTPAEFAVYWLLAIRHKNGLPPLRGEKSMHEEFKAFADSTSSTVMPQMIANNRFSDIEAAGIREIAEGISRKIEDSVEITDGMIHFLPVKGMGFYGISVHPSKIFCPRNY